MCIMLYMYFGRDNKYPLSPPPQMPVSHILLPDRIQDSSYLVIASVNVHAPQQIADSNFLSFPIYLTVHLIQTTNFSPLLGCNSLLQLLNILCIHLSKRNPLIYLLPYLPLLQDFLLIFIFMEQTYCLDWDMKWMPIQGNNKE